MLGCPKKRNIYTADFGWQSLWSQHHPSAAANQISTAHSPQPIISHDTTSIPPPLVQFGTCTISTLQHCHRHQPKFNRPLLFSGLGGLAILKVCSDSDIGHVVRTASLLNAIVCIQIRVVLFRAPGVIVPPFYPFCALRISGFCLKRI